MKLGFIGAGNMASAIMGGIINAGIVNKEDIIAAAANGYGKVAVSNWGYRTYGYDDSFGDYEYNLDLAKEYLAKAEHKEITAIVRGTKTRDVNALTVVQEQARQIGLTINIEGIEAADLSERTQFQNHTQKYACRYKGLLLSRSYNDRK